MKVITDELANKIKSTEIIFQNLLQQLKELQLEYGMQVKLNTNYKYTDVELERVQYCSYILRITDEMLVSQEKENKDE